MGYTHYWRMERDFTEAEWLNIMKASADILSRAINTYMMTLAYEYDQADKKPLVSQDLIRFNGFDDDGHETFMLTREMGEEPEYRRGEGHFAFCKTARKDYDAPVVACLIAAKSIAPDAFTWSSDGWLSEHADGLALANEACALELDWSNVEPCDNDPDRDNVTNVVNLESERDKRA